MDTVGTMSHHTHQHSEDHSHGQAHAQRTMERHADVAIVGGSAAGLGAALQLGRQRRSVIVVDCGTPRNTPAAHMHGYLGHDGLPPADLIAIAREEVRRYGVEVLAGRVEQVEQVEQVDGRRFRVELTGGHSVVARRIVVATGIVDELPEIEGLAGAWGRGVVSCPFCHGFELRDRRITIVATHPMALHSVPLWRHLTDRLTILASPELIDEEVVGRLRGAGISVVAGEAASIATDDGGNVLGIELRDGQRLVADAIAVAPPFRPRIAPFASLGLTAGPHPSDAGTCVGVDETGETAVPGVYAAGNVTDPSLQVLNAAAQGTRVGAMVAFSLAADDLDRADRTSSNQADWDHRYSGSPMWSGNPNGTLVAEVDAMPPGRALDVGAGEGGDAVWLAERGWRVTAADISQRGLDRLDAEARRRGLDIDCRRADANGRDPFERGAYDLVSAFYASIPRTPDDRAIHAMADAVAASGTLLVVGHDLTPMRSPIDPSVASRAFDPDAYVRVDDVARVLSNHPGWKVELHERRERPAGAATHHVHDVVLRARRR